MGYRSKVTLLGLPLIDIVTSPPKSGAPLEPARGWIAVGPIAIGIVFGAGGVAFGLVAVGGAALGFFTLGGVAIGALAIGGLSVGWIAIGGAAFGGYAALGGIAVAREFAAGGLAIANQVLSPASLEFQGTHTLHRHPFRWQDLGIMVALASAVLAVVVLIKRLRGE